MRINNDNSLIYLIEVCSRIEMQNGYFNVCYHTKYYIYMCVYIDDRTNRKTVIEMEGFDDESMMNLMIGITGAV